MKIKQLFPLFLLTTIFVSCNKKEELYEVEIPDSIYENEEVINSPKDVITKDGAFKMKGLNFEYKDLEPFIDAQTVEVHYAKHHVNYLEKLNELVKGTPLEKQSIEEILISIDPENLSLINNAGGFYNHNLYWEILNKDSNSKPTGKISNLIQRDFGSFDNFKSQFKKAGLNLFGSGWVWLILTEQENLKIVTTVNQNNPLMSFEEIKGYPLLNLDLWEHAYYLKYKNNKQEYIDNYFNLIDWEKVNYRIDLQSK